MKMILILFFPLLSIGQRIEIPKFKSYVPAGVFVFLAGASDGLRDASLFRMDGYPIWFNGKQSHVLKYKNNGQLYTLWACIKDTIPKNKFRINVDMFLKNGNIRDDIRIVEDTANLVFHPIGIFVFPKDSFDYYKKIFKASYHQ